MASGLLQTPIDILRRAGWTDRTMRFEQAFVRLVVCLVLFGLVYGGGMGTFRLLAGEPVWLRQVFYSAVKVPLLLVTTFLITLPSFYVLNTLLGLRRDFGRTLRALVAAQAGLAIVLASFAPLTIVWYASSPDYQAALLFNAAMFGAASFTAQWILRGYYRPLFARNPRHRWILRAWIGVYALVGIQMGWLLRPFVGSPGSEVQFLRPEAWDNAYVIVARMVWQMVTG